MSIDHIENRMKLLHAKKKLTLKEGDEKSWGIKRCRDLWRE